MVRAILPTQRKQGVRAWTAAEDTELLRAVATEGEQKWRTIGQSFPHRTHKQCYHRYFHIKLRDRNLGAWSAEEDEQLRKAVKVISKDDGNGRERIRWKNIVSLIKNRDVRQCRERWKCHLSGNYKKTPWTQEEDEYIAMKVAETGRKWTAIGAPLKRSGHSVKFRFFTLQKKEKTKSAEGGAQKALAFLDIEDLGGIFGENQSSDNDAPKGRSESPSVLINPSITLPPYGGEVVPAGMVEPTCNFHALCGHTCKDKEYCHMHVDRSIE